MRAETQVAPYFILRSKEERSLSKQSFAAALR